MSRNPLWDQVELPLFRYEYDGKGGVPTITAERFPPVIAISVGLLEEPDLIGIVVGDGIVTFQCANGSATYDLVERDDARLIWLAVKRTDSEAA